MKLCTKATSAIVSLACLAQADAHAWQIKRIKDEMTDVVSLVACLKSVNPVQIDAPKARGSVNAELCIVGDARRSNAVLEVTRGRLFCGGSGMIIRVDDGDAFATECSVPAPESYNTAFFTRDEMNRPGFRGGSNS